MAREKKGKSPKSGGLAGSSGISLDGGEGLSVSIGAMLGRDETDAERAPAFGEAKVPAAAPSIAAYLSSLQKAVLRRESSGRGGRTVTVVSCRPAPSAEFAGELARAMRKGLGCGSHVEGERVVLQGDIQDRAEAWLTKRGVRVVMGN